MERKTVVKPQRYVYHLTDSSNRMSILENGLISSGKWDKYRNAKETVYAHNNSRPDCNWYPFEYDLYDFPNYRMNLGVSVNFENYYDDVKYKMLTIKYDFWQIDTKKLNRKWYIDIPKKYYGNNFYTSPLYIYTEGNIPSDVLKLYTLYPEPAVFKTDGVAHVTSEFRENKEFYKSLRRTA